MQTTVDGLGLTFQEACTLATGNWFIDKFNLWCGMPLSWKVICWSLIFLLAAMVLIKWSKNWKKALLIISIGIGLWAIFKVSLILLFLKEGLLQSGEIGEQIKYSPLGPIYILVGLL